MLRFKRTLEDQRRLRKALSGLNVALAPHVAERLVRCIAFLAVVGHLLREQDRFVWVSDEDAVLQGSAGIELPRAFQALGNQVVGKRLEAMMYCKPLDESHELLLSLPDLVAGALAGSLPTPYRTGRLTPPDQPGEAILTSLASLPHAHDRGATGTRLLPIVFRADVAREELIPRVLRLGVEEPPVLAATP
jgi:hypothetical protein